MSDEQELTELLGNETATLETANRVHGGYPSPGATAPQPVDPGRQRESLGRLVQWTTDETRFIPAARTVAQLRPGLYDVQADPAIGIFFRSLQIKTEGLLRLPHSSSDLVVAEIAHFWTRRAAYEAYGLAYKRGILLWGPPGSGKSCTIQLVMKDVIERGGIGVVFGRPALTAEGLRMLREIQPATPVVVLMEDLDSIIGMHSESEVLNLLDGAERIDGLVFVASTNYPELLGARIVNRPSRFDRRLKIGHPSAEARKAYLKHIIRGNGRDIAVDEWVRDTEGLSLAHLKELFIAVEILECEYVETIERLRAMREVPTSSSDRRQPGYALANAIPAGKSAYRGDPA